MKPLVPTRGTGKRLVSLSAMAGVSRVVLLAGGRRPLVPQVAAHMVVAFLPLRLRMGLDTVVPLYIMDHPLEYYCKTIHRWFYDPVFSSEGRECFVEQYKCLEYIVVLIHAIGIRTAAARVQLVSILRPPIDDDGSALGAAYRARMILEHGLWALQDHLYRLGGGGGHPLSVDLETDFAELRDLLGVNGELRDFGVYYPYDFADDDMEYEQEQMARRYNPDY